jgi:hypothetical protein
MVVILHAEIVNKLIKSFITELTALLSQLEPLSAACHASKLTQQELTNFAI